MILIDFSSIIHRMVYASCSMIKPKKINGKYITQEFIGLAKKLIIEELFNIKQERSNKFGELVICLDESSKGYWRKEIYSGYKSRRKIGRSKSDVNFPEVFTEINLLIDQIKYNLPWPVVSVETAEADDLILVLAHDYSLYQNILIISPDKDMIQSQRDKDNVFQWSPKTKKWIVPETKNSSMEEWITEHICLGDTGDDVPKVVDHCEFSQVFLQHLSDEDSTGLQLPKITTPMKFKEMLDDNEKRTIIENFKIFKTNRKGESTGILDIYKDTRFGPSNLKKEIAKFGSLDLWLDSHPLYRRHYNRNYKLVMSEGIPSEIWNSCLTNYTNAKKEYNRKEFESYLTENGLKSILMTLPSVFKSTTELTVDDFNW